MRLTCASASMLNSILNKHHFLVLYQISSTDIFLYKNSLFIEIFFIRIKVKNDVLIRIRRFHSMDEQTFSKRRTKNLKKKENFEYCGKFSSKHLRITQELKEKSTKNNIATNQ